MTNLRHVIRFVYETLLASLTLFDLTMKSRKCKSYLNNYSHHFYTKSDLCVINFAIVTAMTIAKEHPSAKEAAKFELVSLSDCSHKTGTRTGKQFVFLPKFCFTLAYWYSVDYAENFWIEGRERQEKVATTGRVNQMRHFEEIRTWRNNESQ
ncbi:hypothetical protein BpHYR1_028386 [Brachionus plicatilis]|uniref:Uncharacterized protein n=1 Tax=Brachionus plicatilis TaxID=10195 RepID=A0A3M7RNR5_BRAPC|nr:hypothetical protein BpHYR1_028386 [Brachionus plicatilis]